MTHLLSLIGRRALSACVQHRPLVGLDFDAALAPLSEDPRAAELSPRTRDLLRAVATLYPCVVLSGRGRAEVKARLIGVPLREVYGNHGIEPNAVSEAALQQVRAFSQRLTLRLAPIAGVWIEEKQYSLTVHYRKAAQPEPARRAVLAAMAELGDAEVTQARQALNVLPAGLGGKRRVLTTAQAQLGCAHAIFLGDDWLGDQFSDQDVFTRCDPAAVLGIRVGWSRTSAAPYYLISQSEVDAMLELLLRLGAANA